jgi:putative DNA primase/helicase
LRGDPHNGRDLAISANNTWYLGFDNLSSVRPWQSDAFCRLSTGGGFSTRALYTDGDEKIFNGTRPILLNGIDLCIERADLLDRAIILSLSPISEEGRQTEADLWAQFEAVRPSILGCLLDAVACALRRLPEIKLPRHPRMADFATWVCAAEPALGWPEGWFLEAYRRNLSEANALALEASPLVKPLLRIAEQSPWEGTATQLQGALKEDFLTKAVDEQWSCPESPRELSQEIRRLIPGLLKVGVIVDFRRTPGDNSERIISIYKSCDGATQEPTQGSVKE